MKTFLTGKMMAFAIAGTLATAGSALADPIEGMWRNKDNVLLKVSACGSQFCVDVMDGKYAGKRSGKMKAEGDGKYSGKLKKFSIGMSFTGNATLKGNTINLKALGGLASDTWKRQ